MNPALDMRVSQNERLIQECLGKVTKNPNCKLQTRIIDFALVYLFIKDYQATLGNSETQERLAPLHMWNALENDGLRNDSPHCSLVNSLALEKYNSSLLSTVKKSLTRFFCGKSH